MKICKASGVCLISLIVTMAPWLSSSMFCSSYHISHSSMLWFHCAGWWSGLLVFSMCILWYFSCLYSKKHSLSAVWRLSEGRECKKILSLSVSHTFFRAVKDLCIFSSSAISTALKGDVRIEQYSIRDLTSVLMGTIIGMTVPCSAGSHYPPHHSSGWWNDFFIMLFKRQVFWHRYSMIIVLLDPLCEIWPDLASCCPFKILFFSVPE